MPNGGVNTMEMQMTDYKFTSAQYQTLGTLVQQYAPVAVAISKELAGRAMLVTFSWKDGSTLLVGIEPDGYPHS